MSWPQDFDQYDGLGLAELVRRRALKAEELLEAAIARVGARNPAVNAVVARLDDQARAAIAAGLPEGPFTGVPYLLKDLGVLYAGAVTSWGSTFFADYVADHDSEITVRLKRAGLVIFGKTNTPEFGLSTSTEPRLFGPTKNPWNAGYSAGGSSGGAAAAVASGMLPMAHATDGGGSIRIPASCCGLFGLKPTRARNPMGPDQGEGWSGASVGHAITRSVRDSAALLDATSGPDVGDPYWAPPPAGPFLAEVGRDPGRLRVALAREVRPDDVERVTWARAVDGRTATAADYARSIVTVHRTGRAVARFFTAYDILLTPTMCRPPHPLGVLDMMSEDQTGYLAALLASIGFTSLFNSSGNPAMSVPLAWSTGGLPLGVQFVAAFGGEATPFRLAGQLEAARPWAARRPPPAQLAGARRAGRSPQARAPSAMRQSRRGSA